MKAQTAGEKAIAVTVMHYIIRDDADRGHGTSHDLFPNFQVGLGITADNWLAGCTTRSVNPNHIF